MTEDTTNPVLENLRRLRAAIERVEADVGDIKLRASAIENHLGQMQIQTGGVNSRLDRLDERVGRIERRPAMDGERVVGREQVTLSLTFDHRIVDGAPAARFLQTLATLVANPGPGMI